MDIQILVVFQATLFRNSKLKMIEVIGIVIQTCDQHGECWTSLLDDHLYRSY